MRSYYDRLQSIIDHAKWLQGRPIPNDDAGQEKNLLRLTIAEESIARMVREIAPEVWVGDPNDPLRRGRPMAPGMDG